jgi:hypothetical protein
MSRRTSALCAVALVLVAAGIARGSDHTILGKKLIVKNPAGREDRRVIVGIGTNRPAGFSELRGNPFADGATLTVIGNGGTSTAQVFTLAPSGWDGIQKGMRYRGPTTGDPVKLVILKHVPVSRFAQLKVILHGAVGTTDLEVLPPNPGDDGGVTLEFPGGDRYCVAFGGAAGGTELLDTAEQWRIVDATAAPGCATSPSITTTTTSTTTSITVPCALTTECNGTCGSGTRCANVGVGCLCLSGGNDDCTVCDPPCTGGQVCHAAFNVAGGTALCGCTTPPVCPTTGGAPGCFLGNCPAGTSCQIHPGFCGCVY